MKGYAYTSVSLELLREVINAPPDAQIVGADMEYTNGSLRVYLVGDPLPKVPEGGCPIRVAFDREADRESPRPE